jgi:bacillithiol biosynthesis cysteine-adding enzyme BshC
MVSHCITQSSIPHTARLFADFLYHFDRVRSFYSFDPFDGQSFFASAKSVSYPEERRAAVAAAMERQARRFGGGERSARNLARFRAGAAAVVTGQQVGLFAGPIFSFYKALTAVRLAGWLSSLGLDCVPVFWLATEDHDLREVNHAFLLNGEGGLTGIEDPGESHAPDAPVGEIRLSPAMAAAVEEAIRSLPATQWTPQFAQALRDSYRPGVTLGEAFARFMAAALEVHGLMFLDPTDVELRRISRPVMHQAIAASDDLQAALIERNAQLTRAAYHTQVHVTEQSALFFVSLDGGRTPVRRRNGQFIVGESQPGASQLLQWLEEKPQDFSPNALLRPVVEDFLLPTVCYVGGPAEVAYMAQAEVLFQRLLGRMPVVFPRASFTLLDRPAADLMDRYGISVLDVLSGPQVLREKMAPACLPADLAAAFTRHANSLQELLGDLRGRLESFDQTLADAAAASGRKMAYQLAKIKRKAGRAAGGRSGRLEADAALLENLIHPRKELQERVYSAVSFAARFGPALFDTIYQSISPSSGDHQVLVIE